MISIQKESFWPIYKELDDTFNLVWDRSYEKLVNFSQTNDIPRQKIKKAKASKKKTKTRNVKVNLAILGGGDIVFPIITSGIVMGVLGLKAALVTTLGATVALTLLFIYSTKGKFYPAMPFITAGLFAGMAIGYLL